VNSSRFRNDQRLLRSVQRLSAVLGKLERQTAASYEISVSQLRVLLDLAERDAAENVRVSDLADDQGLAVSTMTRNLLLLEKQGWVARVQDTQDRRVIQVRLTDAGATRARELQSTTVGQMSRAFAAFHPTDRVERAVALDRVAAALEAIDRE
jgi:MarR family transcriptional regulator, 2-MHQ and catechol-resistance regulon repressor